MDYWQSAFNAMAAIVALLPAALAFAWGRALVRMVDDAALPERLLTHRKRIAQAVAISGSVLIVALPGTLRWSLPVMVLARAIAAFGSRKILLGETWTLWEYLATGFRVYLALIGFWVLLAASPALIDQRPYWVAAIFAFILAAWSFQFPAVTSTLLKARPLTSPELDNVFAGIVARSQVKPPRVLRVGPPGNSFANALALHSRRGSRVLFSERLLETLTAEETAAVFAHEIAHLEILDSDRRWPPILASVGLIGGATVLVPSLRFPGLGWALHLGWALFVLVYLAFRLRRSQAHELASDRRATELCGNPEAMIHALIKIHMIGRVPRRWETRVEESSSHPSLARRIQTIRAANQTVTPGSEGTELFAGADAGTFITIDREAIRFYASVPAGTDASLSSVDARAGTITVLRFPGIAEMRVAARGIDSAELVVVERNGTRHGARIRPEDLARLQRMLDQVDVLIPPAPKSMGYAYRLIAVLSACLAAVAALLTVQAFSVTLVALVAAFLPLPVLVTAAGIISALGGILVVAWERHCSVRELLFLLGVLPLAATALWLRLRSGEPHPVGRSPRWVLWTLGAAAVVWWVPPILAAQGHLLQLSESFRSAVGATLLPCALAILLAQSSSSRIRASAVPLLALACAPAIIGSDWFRDKVIRDPMMRSIPAFESAPPVSSGHIAVFTVDPWASGLRIAPGGTCVALRHVNPDSDEESAPPYVVYGARGTRTSMECLDLRFIDDQTVLLLRAAGAGMELAAWRIDGSPSQWHVLLNGPRAGRLTLSPDAARWRVVSQSRDGTLSRIEGSIWKQDTFRTEWKAPASQEPWTLQGFAGTGPVALWVRQTWTVPRLARAASILSAVSGGYAVESGLYAGTQSSTTLLGRSESRVTCLQPAWDDTRFVCTAYRGNLTNVFFVDAAAGSLVPAGSIQGNFDATSTADGGVVAGSWNGLPSLLRLREHQIIRLAEQPGEAALTPKLLGVATGSDQQNSIVINGL
jgi:Zn-dependent protease with chaperone function